MIDVVLEDLDMIQNFITDTVINYIQKNMTLIQKNGKQKKFMMKKKKYLIYQYLV